MFGYSPLYYHYSFWPEGFVSLVVNALFWVALISLFVFLFRRIGGHHHGAGCCGIHGDHGEEGDDVSYMNIIKERYAKGEIDKKQFEELKKDLSEE